MRGLSRLKTQLLLAGLLLVILHPSASGQNSWKYKKEVIDSVLELQYFSTRMPGYAMCIVKDGEIIYSGLRGKANVKEDIKMSLNTQFNIGSVTKQFTAAAIYLLEEEGKMSLNDDIRKYIPELPAYPTPITIDQLLHHTSGVRDHTEVTAMLGIYKDKNVTLDGMLDWVQKYPELNTAPGTYFAYSNTGYMLLAVVIERISGKSYAQYLEENIFAPLGMKNTYVEEGKHKYLRDGTTHYEINYKQTRAKRASPFYNALGAVGVISTLTDMVIWDNNFYNNKLGKGGRSLITKMETSGALTDGTDVHYGGGLLVKTYRNKPVYEHSGGWGEYLTQYRRFPDEKVSVIICMNSYLTSPFEMADRVSDALFYYREVHPFVQNPVSEKVIAEISAPYAAENNLIRYVYQEKGKLYISRISEGDTTAYPLMYIGAIGKGGGHAFMDSTGSSAVFHYVAGKPHHLTWAEGTYFTTDRNYTYIDTTAPVNYFRYGGRYYCAALDKKIRIQYFSKEDEISIHPFPFVKYTLQSKGGDYYQIEGEPYIVYFGNGYLLFGNDWIFNFRFEKKQRKKIDLWPF